MGSFQDFFFISGLTDFIEKLIQSNPSITPQMVFTQINDRFNQFDSDVPPINFTQAYELDTKFFGKEGARWLTGFSTRFQTLI